MANHLDNLTIQVGSYDDAKPDAVRLQLHDSSGTVSMTLHADRLEIIDQRGSTQPLPVRDERPAVEGKWIVFGFGGGTCEFTHVVVTAPRAGKALVVAEAMEPLFDGVHFKALAAMDATYLRQLAEDVDVAAQPEHHVWSRGRHGKLKHRPMGNPVPALEVLQQVYADGEHGSDCTSRHGAGECGCGRSDVGQALETAGFGV